MSDERPDHFGGMRRSALQRMREELESTKAQLCPCGVTPDLCAIHRPEPTDDAEEGS